MIDIPPFIRRRLCFFKMRAEGRCVILNGCQVNRAGMLAYRAFRTPKRPKISPFLRWELGAKQAFKCRLCQALLQAASEVDHIIPRMHGGSDDDSNLQVLCCNCHGEKSRLERKKFLNLPLYFQAT